MNNSEFTYNEIVEMGKLDLVFLAKSFKPVEKHIERIVNLLAVKSAWYLTNYNITMLDSDVKYDAISAEPYLSILIKGRHNKNNSKLRTVCVTFSFPINIGKEDCEDIFRYQSMLVT